MRYTILHNYGMLPNQIEGMTDDGKYFYFRGRGGRWQLHFGATLDEAVGGPGFEGVNDKAGWFEKNEWEQFFWEVIEQVENGTAEKLDWERHKKDMEALLVRLMTPATPEQIAEALARIKKEEK